MVLDFDERLDQIRRVADKKFSDCILIHMPHYVCHGFAHSTSIERHLHCFLLAHADKPKLKLNEYEKFLLVSAIWLHDIGMTDAKFEGEDPEIIRKEHHKRSHDMLLEPVLQKELGLTELEGDIVAKLSLLHRRFEDILETFRRYEELKYDDGTCYYGKSRTYLGIPFKINCEKLAMLLRIIDACDRDHERAKDIETIAKIAKLPKESVMHHYIHSLIDSVDFVGSNILLHTHCNSDTDRNMIDEIVCNDIKKELDSLEPLLEKYDVHKLSVIQKPSHIAVKELPEELYDYYIVWRNKQLSRPELEKLFKYFLIEKDAYIFKTGHAIIEFKYDTIVHEMIESVIHTFSTGDSATPDFRFKSLQTMESESLENRFREQTFYYHIIEHSLNEPIHFSATERENIGDPFRHKEFYLKFDKPVRKNTRVKYGWGFSAPKLFDVENTMKSMSSKYMSFTTNICKMLLSLSFERGLNITELRFLVSDEDNEELYCMNLDKSQTEFSCEGLFKYRFEDNLVCRKHIMEIEGTKKNRAFYFEWRFRGGE
jgi:hypothetical protein